MRYRSGFFPRTRLNRFGPEKQVKETAGSTLPSWKNKKKVLSMLTRKNRLANKEFIYNQNPVFRSDPLEYSLLKNSAKSGNPNYLDVFKGIQQGGGTNLQKRQRYRLDRINQETIDDYRRMFDTMSQKERYDKKDISNDIETTPISYNLKWSKPRGYNETYANEKTKSKNSFQTKVPTSSNGDEEKEKVRSRKENAFKDGKSNSIQLYDR